MEIHQLRYFVAVAEEGSFSHAAEREHVSQLSLSQQIHKLEEELPPPQRYGAPGKSEVRNQRSEIRCQESGAVRNGNPFDFAPAFANFGVASRGRLSMTPSRIFSFACDKSANLSVVITLGEIEAAADALPLEQKKKLIKFLESRVNGDREIKAGTDLAKFSGAVRLSEEPLSWQQRVRGEWE